MQASERQIQTSLLSPSSHQACEHSLTSSTGKSSSQDQRKLISDRQSSLLLPGAVTSPIVASNPDGRGAVCSRRSLSVCQRGRTSQPRLSRCSHQSSRSALFQKGPAIYQLVYESHLLKARGGHQRGKARRPSVRPRPIGVWQQCAPDWQASKTPSCQDSACRYDGAHSEKPTNRVSAGPVCSLDGP